MSKLRILLLGSPQVIYDEKPLHITRRIQRALLFYLAIEGRLVRRNELINLFYPSEADDSARRHLREALSKLRADLPNPDVLICIQDRVGLDHEKVYCDAAVFGQVFNQVKQLPRSSSGGAALPANQYQMLIHAVNLWQAPQFMSGAALPDIPEVDAWFSRKGRELEEARILALERLANHASTLGDREATLDWLRQALEADELNENLHYRIMNLLINLGRRVEAIQYYHNIETLFQRELDIDPPPSIIALYRKAQTNAPIAQPVDLPNWPIPIRIQTPYVGREVELNVLHTRYQQGGCVALIGEAGSGKSRTVQEFFLTAHPAPRMLLVPSRLLERNLPFQPIIEMLRSSTIQEEDWNCLAPVWIGCLGILLPDLLLRFPDLPPQPQMTTEQARALIFEAFRQLCLVLAQNRRILFFLDDAQWADEATLATFSYLMERDFFVEHGLFVLAARPEESNSILEGFLHPQNVRTAFQMVHLGPLSNDEITEFTHCTMGDVPSAEFIQKLVHDTGGNPLFLAETLRAVMERNLAPGSLDQDYTELPLAGSLQTLVRRRLSNLSQTASQILSLAAVCGNMFSLQLIEKASGMELEDVVTAVDELESVRLIQAQPNSLTGPIYHFVHEKIREVLELEISPARSRLYHLRVAESLETISARVTPQPASVIARHYELGGEPRAAFPYWIQAGQMARRLFSQTEAYIAFSRAESLLRVLNESLSEAEIYGLYASWGELAVALTDQVTIQRVYHTLLRLGQNRHSRYLVGVALSGLSCLSQARGKYAEGLIYLAQALPFLENQDVLFELVLAYIRRGNLLGESHKYQESIASYEKAIDLCKESESDNLLQARSKACFQAAWVFIHTGWPEKGYQYADQALLASQWGADPVHEIQANSILGLASIMEGKFGLARLYSQRGLWISKQLRIPFENGRLHMTLTRSELALGNLDGAWEHWNYARESAENDKDSFLMSQVDRTFLGVDWLAGQGQNVNEIMEAWVTDLKSGDECLDFMILDDLILEPDLAPDFNAPFWSRLSELNRLTEAYQVSLPVKYWEAFRLWRIGKVQAAKELNQWIEKEACRRGYGSLPFCTSLFQARLLADDGQYEQSLNFLKGIRVRAGQQQDIWTCLFSLRLERLIRGDWDYPVDSTRLEMISLLDQLEKQTTSQSVCIKFETLRNHLLA